ncbi:MAG: hypothetical protein AB1513_05695 [Pseudomonadota bacterium]
MSIATLGGIVVIRTVIVLFLSRNLKELAEKQVASAQTSGSESNNGKITCHCL